MSPRRPSGVASPSSTKTAAALLNGYKFDLRLFVLVKQPKASDVDSVFAPPQVLLFSEGVVRFASAPYEHSFGGGAGS